MTVISVFLYGVNREGMQFDYINFLKIIYHGKNVVRDTRIAAFDGLYHYYIKQFVCFIQI